MRIAEIFRSYQGEGRLTGAESIFVRTSGCNLRCRFCDTPYASWSPEGEDLAVDEILERIERLDSPEERLPPPASWRDEGNPSGKVRHVVLTGGEPMLFSELAVLCRELRQQGRHVTVETSGTVLLPIECDLMSISPKLSNSTPPAEIDPRWAWRHESARCAPEVLQALAASYDCQYKFVVDTPEDCREIESYLAEHPWIARPRVMLMPQGTDAESLASKAEWLEPHCHAHGYHFCPRRHVEWFGGVRGT